MTIIVTKRLQLKPLNMSEDSIRTQVKWLNDPEVTRYSEQRHRKHDFYSQLGYLTHFGGGPDRFVEIYLGEKMIGTMTAYVDVENSVADMGIMIGDKESWGRGYGAEAWQAFSDTLLVTGIRKIEAGCMAANYPMMSIARKTEMIVEGRRIDHFYFEDELWDMVLWARHSL